MNAHTLSGDPDHDLDDLAADPERQASRREDVLARAERHAAEVEAIFAAHADGLVIYGPDGEIRSANPAALRIFAFREGEAPGYCEHLSRFRPTDEDGNPLDPEELPSRRALRGERVQGVVLGVHRGKLWISASAAPLRAADGTIVGAVASLVDVTHLRRLREEREQVIRTLTHDARTRLNVIAAHAEMLSRSDAGDVRRRAEVIASSARRLADMIDALVERP